MDLITAIIEQFGITLTAGVSIVAIAFYFYSLCNEANDCCRRLQHLVYKILRVGMVLLAVVFSFNFLLGAVDSNTEVVLEYGLKLTILLTVIIAAILMTKHVVRGKFLIPVPVATWTFLSFLHFSIKVIGLDISSAGIFFLVLLFYILFLSFVYLLFFGGRYYCDKYISR